MNDQMPFFQLSGEETRPHARGIRALPAAGGILVELDHGGPGGEPRRREFPLGPSTAYVIAQWLRANACDFVGHTDYWPERVATEMTHSAERAGIGGSPAGPGA